MCCKACGKGDSVLFGNAHIESTGGHLLHHEIKGTACGHGRRYAHDIGVALGQLNDGVAKDILIFERLAI